MLTIKKFKPFVFQGYKIQMSGKHAIKVTHLTSKTRMGTRVTSIDAAKAMIFSQGRVMTRKEHSLVHNVAIRKQPTQAQAKSEQLVRDGAQGFI